MRKVSPVRPRRLLSVCAALVLAAAGVAAVANGVSPDGIQGTGHVSVADRSDGIQGTG